MAASGLTLADDEALMSPTLTSNRKLPATSRLPALPTPADSMRISLNTNLTEDGAPAGWVKRRSPSADILADPKATGAMAGR